MKAGTFLGIVFKVNPFFLLLMALAFGLGQLLPALVLFVIVLFHELAHALAASAYGLRVAEVELLPFGGVARIDHVLEFDPKIEIGVALAGPLSNLLFAAVLWLWQTAYSPLDHNWFLFLTRANLSMAALNLLPGLPLDGGRVLRSVLIYSRGLRRATETAAGLGKALAVGLIAFGLIGSLVFNYPSALMAGVVGVFLFGAAKRESDQAVYVFLRYLMQKQLHVGQRRVMPVRGLVAAGETSLGDVSDYLIPAFYHLFWIVDRQGKPLGILTELELINGLLEKGIHGTLYELVEQRSRH